MSNPTSTPKPLLNRLREFVEDELAVRRASFMPEPSASESAQIKEAEELLAELHARLAGDSPSNSPTSAPDESALGIAMESLTCIAEEDKEASDLKYGSDSDGVMNESRRALAQSALCRIRKAADSGASLESRVGEWVRTRIGPDHMHSRERAMRLLEEAVELAQAEGIGFGAVEKQVNHVFNRPAGEPKQEAAGVAVCLLGWCASTGVFFDDIARQELARIEAKPLTEIRGSLARKADADLVSVLPSQCSHGNHVGYCAECEKTEGGSHADH